jgi:hypothetical protein
MNAYNPGEQGGVFMESIGHFYTFRPRRKETDLDFIDIKTKGVLGFFLKKLIYQC